MSIKKMSLQGIGQNYKWELTLFVFLLLVQVINIFLSPYYLRSNFFEFSASYLDKYLLVFPMAMIIIMGAIDISVASIMVLSAVSMSLAYNAGLSFPLALLFCLLISAVCGLINGLLIVAFQELSSVIITICTMIIYRGIAYILLEDQASGNFPVWFGSLAWNPFLGLPVLSWIFIATALFFAFLLHSSKLGRAIYAIGQNRQTCHFFGIQVNAITLFAYTLMGFLSGVSAIFLSSRLGSTRPNMAMGYELDIITVVVLGGVAVSGGKGNMGGCLLSALIIICFRYGLGLRNIPAQVILVFVGLLLLAAAFISAEKKKNQ